MTKKYFTEPDFGDLKPVLPEIAKKQEVLEETIKEGWQEILKPVNEELDKIKFGTSTMVAPVQFNDKIPFLVNLQRFHQSPTRKLAVTLIELAEQDFNKRFADFVKLQLSNVFKGL